MPRRAERHTARIDEHERRVLIEERMERLLDSLDTRGRRAVRRDHAHALVDAYDAAPFVARLGRFIARGVEGFVAIDITVQAGPDQHGIAGVRIRDAAADRPARLYRRVPAGGAV